MPTTSPEQPRTDAEQLCADLTATVRDLHERECTLTRQKWNLDAQPSGLPIPALNDFRLRMADIIDVAFSAMHPRDRAPTLQAMLQDLHLHCRDVVQYLQAL